MADIERDRHVAVERDSSAVWIVVVLLVVVLLVLLFIWPGWVVGPRTTDTGPDTINIEQEQGQPPQQDQDINIIVPDASDETT